MAARVVAGDGDDVAVVLVVAGKTGSVAVLVEVVGARFDSIVGCYCSCYCWYRSQQVGQVGAKVDDTWGFLFHRYPLH